MEAEPRRETALQQTQRIVIEGQHHIDRQRRIIAELRDGGHATRDAEDLLKVLLDSQAQHEERLARLTAQEEQA